MKHFAVIGSPIAHSRSPEIYERFFIKYGVDADFVRIKVEPEELCKIHSITKELSGFAVTMPLKRRIIQYLDRIESTASACGAVNIVEKRDNKLIGHNTDGDGLVDALLEAGVDPAGKTALILGRGGAAHSAAAALERHNCRVELLVRSIGGNLDTDKEYSRLFPERLISNTLPHADIFINATPLGMRNADDFNDFGFIESIEPDTVFDMVYLTDGSTRLFQEARKRGIRAIDGSRMLYMQAVRAFEIFTGIKADRG